jgi:tetratricopeptide (TPR) repeat protein
MNAWQKLRSGKTAEALADMIAQHSRDASNPSTTIQLGIAYMWLGRWEQAWSHFDEFIEHNSVSTDIMPKFAGTAMWCAGRRESAIEEWKRGLEADYMDASGGVTIPLHLYFAAAACPTLLNIAEIERQIRQVLLAKGNEYPGLLGCVALGELGRTEALQIAAECDPHGTQQHQWEIAFWEGVHFLVSGRKQDFLKEMDLVANVSWEDFDRNETDFIDRIWSSEFFLARHHRSIK